MDWNKVIVASYNFLVSSGILIGALKTKPMYTVSSNSVTVEDATLIELDNLPIGANTETVLLTIRNRATFDGNTNALNIKLATLTFGTSGNKDVKFKLYGNSITGGTFYEWDTLNSRVEVSTDTTLNTTTIIIGTITRIVNQIGLALLSKEDSQRYNLLDGDIIFTIKPNESITITATSTNSSLVSLITRIKEK